MFKIATEKISENILFEGEVGLWKDFKAIQGKLYLTPKRVLFKSTDYKMDILLGDLAKAKIFSLLGLITNGMLLKKNKGFEVFFLENKYDWIYSINEQLAIAKA